MLHQESALKEGQKLEEMQAARISELEAELTTKDKILKQTLQAAKNANEENEKLKSDLTRALEATMSAQADKDKAVKEAHEFAQQALKVKEDEIQWLLKRDVNPVSMASTAKRKFIDMEVSHKHKYPVFIFFNLCFNIHVYNSCVYRILNRYHALNGIYGR